MYSFIHSVYPTSGGRASLCEGYRNIKIRYLI